MTCLIAAVVPIFKVITLLLLLTLTLKLFNLKQQEWNANSVSGSITISSLNILSKCAAVSSVCNDINFFVIILYLIKYNEKNFRKVL